MNRVSRTENKRRARLAFTLVELLVVMAIIGVLIGLAMPAIQSTRESARRSQCGLNLMSISIALEGYHDRWSQYPVGTIAENDVILNIADGNHHNWLGRLTDLLDQPVIAAKIDRSVSVYGPPNGELLACGTLVFSVHRVTRSNRMFLTMPVCIIQLKRQSVKLAMACFCLTGRSLAMM